MVGKKKPPGERLARGNGLSPFAMSHGIQVPLMGKLRVLCSYWVKMLASCRLTQPLLFDQNSGGSLPWRFVQITHTMLVVYPDRVIVDSVWLLLLSVSSEGRRYD